MINLTSGFVPNTYSDSRDYRVLLKILGIVVNVFKSNIDSFPSLYDAENCPDHLLPLLADMVGYEYDFALSVEANRIIIKNYPMMLRDRGSLAGFKLAVATSININPSESGRYPIDSLIVDFDTSTGTINIYYPLANEIRRDLIEVVRPVGTVVELIPAQIRHPIDELRVETKTKGETEEYNEDKRLKVSQNDGTEGSEVGFGNVDIEVQ